MNEIAVASSAGMSLERFAEISAALRGRTGVDAHPILASFGVAPDDWERAAQQWRVYVDGELERGNPSPVKQFAAAFRKARTAQPAAPLASPPVPSRVASTDPRAIDTTSPEVRLLGPVLPFTSSPNLEFLARLASPVEKLPLEDVGETVEFRPVLEDNSPVTPFDEASTPREHRLSLEQYASLTAEIAHTPRDAAAILSRYGLTNGGALAATQRAWADRLQRDAAEAARFDELVALYRRYLHVLRPC